MHPLNSGVIAAGLVLLAPSMASAHEEGNTASILYHYLSSPDHVMVLGILIATCVGVGAWAIGSSLKMARQRKH